MRKIMITSAVSLDGYMEGPGRDISWHRVDAELHRHLNELLAPLSAFIDGRVTHQLMADYWPTAADDPAASREAADFAEIWLSKKKYVLSRTLEEDRWNTEVVREFDPDWVRELKATSGAGMAVGGANLMAQFMRHDLIDEYRLYLNPVVVGGGTPLFPPGLTMDLRLIETRPFGQGVVELTYRPGPKRS
ncbi:dihydrofolate reductase family protein [Herbidospora sp. NBRC 101105]|uniref:dihydrofolate reductase family protein n=1 Tax=Herbidospora sp. NBRC 101105 TaxID=3032195 RepID=UPI0024A38C85|nr:dihydrofolate reductase family protein [Herbidospora sp. NBRC 101105]GLX95347.1 riboflavin biosynthesis protein RibD [Herbidospora sp. NBRC 101105]